MSQVAPILHREPVEIAPRLRPSPRTRAAVLLKTMGRCAICAVKIEGGLFEVDHIIRHADGGADHIDNYQPLCPPCHREKTRTIDTPGAAKTKRMAKAGKVREPDEIEPSRLQGRGFDKRLTKGFCGKVKPRKQRRNKSPSVQQAWSGGTERSDCEADYKATNDALQSKDKKDD